MERSQDFKSLEKVNGQPSYEHTKALQPLHRIYTCKLVSSNKCYSAHFLCSKTSSLYGIFFSLKANVLKITKLEILMICQKKSSLPLRINVLPEKY